jgi:GntR family negative regulator for fad regulon and positive regulator of fabA
MVIKAQSPAGFAEEYIIESIWNNRFPAGSILPAERELSELIGVTAPRCVKCFSVWRAMAG